MNDERWDVNHSPEIMTGYVPTVDEIVDALPEWGRCVRGGLPSGASSLHLSNNYEDGPESGRETARGKQSKPALFVHPEEWPRDVVFANRAWEQVRPDFPEHAEALLIHYTAIIGTPREFKARKMRVKVSTWDKLFAEGRRLFRLQARNVWREALTLRKETC